MFYMSSVAVFLKQQADSSRFVVLNLATPAPSYDKAAKDKESAQFEMLKSRVEQAIQRDTSARLFGRLIQMIPVIRRNTEVFTAAAAKVLGSQRLGDQMGVLLACAWALSSTGEVDIDTAVGWVRGSDWGEHVADSTESDHERAKRVLLGHQLRVEGANSGGSTRTVGELVALAARFEEDAAISSEMAARSLGRIGLKIVDDGMIVHNNLDAIAKIYADTPWSSGWNRMLRRLSDRTSPRNNLRFCPGISGRGLWIPIDCVFDIQAEPLNQDGGQGKIEDEPLFD